MDNDRLKKLKLEAAHIVTGLTVYSSRYSLYQETGWEKLSSRRERRKLCLMYMYMYNMYRTGITCTMDTPHIICVIYYPLLFVMLPTTLFETEMTTLFQDVDYRYTNLRSSRLS